MILSFIMFELRSSELPNLDVIRVCVCFTNNFKVVAYMYRRDAKALKKTSMFHINKTRTSKLFG